MMLQEQQPRQAPRRQRLGDYNHLRRWLGERGELPTAWP